MDRDRVFALRESTDFTSRSRTDGDAFVTRRDGAAAERPARTAGGDALRTLPEAFRLPHEAKPYMPARPAARTEASWLRRIRNWLTTPALRDGDDALTDPADD